MRFFFRALLCAVLWLAVLAPLQAAVSDPAGRLPFQVYGREAGLGNLRVNLLLQDLEGFIWVATDRGLYRFDGRQFQAFGLAQGLPSLEVNALRLDAAGRMWVGTRQGLARWTGQRFDAQPPGLPADLAVNEIAAGPDGQLWVATRSGLYRGDAAGFKPDPQWPGRGLNTIAASPDGKTLWAGTRKTLWRWTAEQGWQAFEGRPSLDGEELDQLLAAADGRVWLRSSRHTYVLDPGASRFRTMAELPPADTFLSRLHQGADGAVWIPTGKGIYRYFQGELSSIGLAHGLPTDFTRALLLDREGNLWCGSLGLHRLMGRGAWRAHTPKEGLPAYVWSLLRARDGRLWVGTEKGLARGAESPPAQHDAQSWEIVPGTEERLVRAIVQTADGGLVFGGEPYGLQRLDARGRKLESLGLPSAGGRKVLSLLLDGEQQLWVGTHRGGLLRGRPDGSSWVFEPVPLPGAPPDEIISHLMSDRRGRLWAAGSAGLLLYSGGRWQRFGPADGLASAQALYVSAGRGDEIWLAYRDKPGVVSRLRHADGRLQLLQALAPPALPAVDLTLIGEDAAGRLWLGSHAGLELVERPREAQPALYHFGVEDGLVDEEANAMAFLAEPDGRVWIGTRGGLAQFDSGRYTGAPPPPRVAVLAASLGGQPIDAAGAPRVGAEQNTFEIRFAALSYLDTGGIGLQARLLGLESDWHEAPTREARYAGLPPGDYTMELQARFRTGPWGPATRLGFTILPPWWQTWWFRALAAAAALLALWLFEQYRARRLLRRTATLEALVAARTQELEAANQALKDQSLTDALTRLHNRRYLQEVMPEHVSMALRGQIDQRLGQARREVSCSDLALIMVDIDKFKSINDGFGHAAGDLVLQQVAQILRECTREADSVVRWGGEEFVVVARQTCRDDAARLPERIRARFEAHRFDLGNGQSLMRSCSLGFVLYPFFPAAPRRLGWEQLLDLADQCLYVAKRSGRNAWVGVLPAADAEPAAVAERLADELEDLVGEGLLELQTSLPPATPLRFS
ncbi:ligand-binding sensor domain-containing diguanylate cyclase [Roseateles violae]|uniref:diguanylate cyclase n=1 Tax=Roseateles violae TaxID=3058042 RepID=A0ABT8DL10_9BURK|nr:ligand-binding sensor domain-containing diguanylate cyclase [Pelomonas sp. PFR6]MDN3918787.1 diguanylate cyclase [Pelomonas sp. PFR6]